MVNSFKGLGISAKIRGHYPRYGKYGELIDSQESIDCKFKKIDSIVLY